MEFSHNVLKVPDWFGLIKKLVVHPQAGSNNPIKNRSKETTPKSFPQKEEDTMLSEVADT